MRGPDAHGVSAVNLRVKLQVHLFRIDPFRGRPVVMEITVLVDQAWNHVFGYDRTPAVVNPLARQCKVQAEIDMRMRFGVIGNLRKPWAGHHNAGGVDQTGVQSCDGRRVYGMSHADVVGMYDQEFCIRSEAQLFCQRPAVDLRMRFEESADKKNKEPDRDTLSIHWLDPTAFPALALDWELVLSPQSSKVALDVIVNLVGKPFVGR